MRGAVPGACVKAGRPVAALPAALSAEGGAAEIKLHRPGGMSCMTPLRFVRGVAGIFLTITVSVASRAAHAAAVLAAARWPMGQPNGAPAPAEIS